MGCGELREEMELRLTLIHTTNKEMNVFKKRDELLKPTFPIKTIGSTNAREITTLNTL